MKTLIIGSIHLDHIYNIDHFVQPGETISSDKFELLPGGKGLNQSISMAKSGVDVYLGGAIGNDAADLISFFKEINVNTDLIEQKDAATGHTVIQVDKNGQNAIIVYGGTNRMLTEEYIDSVLGNFSEGDYLLLQNEINLLPYIIDKAYEKKIIIVLNPSPFTEEIRKCNLNKISYFLLNELEAFIMTKRSNPKDQMDSLINEFPNARFVLTLGDKGSYYKDASHEIFQDIYRVEAVDTTGAGDTFTGFFLGSIIKGIDIKKAMSIAAKASSLAVAKKGAAISIPSWDEVIGKL